MLCLNLPPKFVSRESEFEFLKSKLNIARECKGTTVFIAGESGVGKTRIVEELIDLAERLGFQIFRGQCFLESLAPYAPLASVLKEAGIEHLLTQGKPPKLEALYAINKGGVVVAKYERLETIDPDLFMGMVTAVENFVKDSVSQIQKGNVSEQIGHMGYGNFNIVNVPGRRLNLVAVTTGRENEYLISDMEALLSDIERKNEDMPNEMNIEIESRIRALVLSGKYEGIDYAEEDAKIRQANLFENVARGIQRKSEQKPVLIFIDDLQWSDPSSLAMLHYIARNTRKNAVLIVGAYRSEEIVARYDGKVHHLVEVMEKMAKEEIIEKVELKRLSRESCHVLICSVLGSEIGKDFTDKIYKETEGNTFFVIEILKNLSEEKQLNLENGKWQYNIEQIQIPSKVYEIVVQRLQKLAKEDREILDAASVLGEEFNSHILSKILEIPRTHVVRSLVNMERLHKLIRAVGEKYRFEHSKIREVLYSELTEDMRHLYHEIVGKALEEEYLSGKQEHLSDILFHYQKSGIKPKIIEYGFLAGKIAKEKFANEEAERFLREVLEASDTDKFSEFKIKALDELAEILELEGKYLEAAEFLKIRIANTVIKDITEAGKCYRKLAEIYLKKGDFETALRSVEESELLLSSEETSRLELARTWSAKANVYVRKGEYRKAIDILERAVELFEKVNAEKDTANAFHRIGIAYFYLCEYEKALGFLMKSLVIRERLTDLRGCVLSYNTIGAVHQEIGEYAKAIENYLMSCKISEKIGDVRGIALSYSNIGLFYHERGEYEKALEYYGKSILLKEKIGDVRGIALSYANMGLFYYEKGDYDEALRYCEKSLAINIKIGDPYSIALANANIGLVYYEKGDHDKALEFLQKALDGCLKVGNKKDATIMLVDIGEVYLARSDIQNAEKHLEEAKKTLEELGLRSTLGYFYHRYALLSLAKGDYKEGVERLQKSIDFFKEIKRENIDYYKALFEMGRITRNREMIETALKFFERIRNQKWAERVRMALIALK